jgi:hypothetical protein
LSTSGISSSLLSQIASSPSASNQFLTDLNQVAQDLKGDNLSAAQQDFVTLSQDALNGVTSSSPATTPDSGVTASLLTDVTSSTGSENSFLSELNQLGSDLQNGDLTSAQNDILSIGSTASNAAPVTAASSSQTSNPAQISEVIQAIVQAMEAGDDSAAGSAMSQLASISPSSQGASYLAAESANFGSSSSSSSGSLSQLLQGLGSNNSSSSASSLNLLA